MSHGDFPFFLFFFLFPKSVLAINCYYLSFAFDAVKKLQLKEAVK